MGRAGVLLALFIVAVALIDSSLGGRKRLRLVCSQPREGGDCIGSYKVYGYDPRRRRCQQFVYTGCGGNTNRFKTNKICLRTCKGRRMPLPSTPYYPQIPGKCMQRKVTGSCSRRFARFYFDIRSKTCKPFIYTGCGNSKNRFKSMWQCMSYCWPNLAKTTTAAPTTAPPTTTPPPTTASTTTLVPTTTPTTTPPPTTTPTTTTTTTPTTPTTPTTTPPTTTLPTTTPTTTTPTTTPTTPTTTTPTPPPPPTTTTTTEAPTTEAPTTEAPTTEAPTTEAQTTEEPTADDESIPFANTKPRVDLTTTLMWDELTFGSEEDCYSDSGSGLYSDSDSGLYSDSDSGLYSDSGSGLYSDSGSDSGLYSDNGLYYSGSGSGSASGYMPAEDEQMGSNSYAVLLDMFRK